jgi:DNA-binding SARP family transcriptional activator/ABC-type transport system substrate-binding protein
MQFHLLGPLEARNGGGDVDLGGARQRAVLTLLLLHRREVVSVERLIDELWGDEPPPTAAKTVQVYVSRLRKAMGDGQLETHGHGYRLAVEPGALDIDRFESLLAGARGSPDPAGALASLDAALALWRGAALADCAYESFAQREIDRLDELRLTARETRADALLALGRHAELVPELEALLAQHPLRERLRSQLMLALYRCGRQADALKAFHAARTVLREQQGLEPGPELRRLQAQVLAQDPALDLPLTYGRARRRRRGRAALALAIGAGVAAVVVLAAGNGGGEDGVRAGPNSLAVVDLHSGRLVADVGVGVGPGPVAYGAGSIWAANVADGTVSRVDARTRALQATVSIEGVPAGLAADAAGVWVTTTAGRLYRIDPRFNSAVTVAHLQQPTFGLGATVGEVASGLGSLWVTDAIGTVTRVDPATHRIVARTGVGLDASGLTVSGDAVWIANRGDGTVSRVVSGKVTTVPVGHGPQRLAAGAGAIWVADALDGSLARIDPRAARVQRRIAAGRRPVDVAVAAGSLWVADAGGEALLRLDPRTGRITQRTSLGATPLGLVAAGGELWVSLAAAPARAVPAGGTIRVDAADDAGALDPARMESAYAPSLAYLTTAKLMDYPDRPAPAGSRVAPDVALSAPERSPDGRRYTFTVRPGFRFSPPSGETVTAETFRFSIERTLNPRAELQTAVGLDDVVGMAAFRAGRAKHVSGIEVSGDRIAFRLLRPSGDLPIRLSSLGYSAVPIGTPLHPRAGTPIPSAGPFYVASYAAGRQLVLRRNPNYGGDRPRGPAEVDVAVGVSSERARADVEAGRADYALSGVPNAEQPRLQRRYGGGPRRRYFVNRVPSLRMLELNTARPLFAERRMRLAVAAAVDRPALAALQRRYAGFGTLGGGPATSGYLPPAPAADASPPPGPDLDRARALAGSRRRTAVLYTCNEAPCPQQARIIQRNLAAIGIAVKVRALPKPRMYAYVSRRGAAYDIVTTGWSADVGDPADFVGRLDGDTIGPEQNANLSYFDAPAVSTRIHAAARLTGASRYRAFARLAADLEHRESPLVVFATDESRDFFSARVGCQVYQPLYGMDLATLCLRPAPVAPAA